jgi:hypothetical protein
MHEDLLRGLWALDGTLSDWAIRLALFSVFVFLCSDHHQGGTLFGLRP